MAQLEQNDQPTDSNHDVLIESSVLATAIELTYASRATAEQVAESVLAAAAQRGTVRVAMSRSDFGMMVNEGTLVLDFAIATNTRVKVSESAPNVGNAPGIAHR
jgi:hypothetical protein